MRWAGKLRHLGSLSIAVAALGGGLFAARKWAESHALSTVLGPNAKVSALKVHWTRSAGCAEKITIPLTPASDSGFSTAQLTAGRMWFTYDLAALMKKRLVVPRVVIENAKIDARMAIQDFESLSDALAVDERQMEKDAALAPLEWLAGVRSRIESLESEQFIRGTQVAVDTAMLSEHWRAEFASIRERANRVLGEARDIQKQLSTLDNVLRHEARVIANRDRLDILKTTLAAMKSDLARIERILRDQQSRVREALLIEKNALREQGLAFRVPEASRVAAKTTKLWVASCLREPAQLSYLMQELVHKPYATANAARGENLRTFQPGTPELAVSSAKISGEIAMGPKVSPFTASGNFESHSARPASGVGREGEQSHWQISVGPPVACLSLDSHSSEPRAGVSHVSLHSNAPGHLEAECEFFSAHSELRGSGQLLLRQWLSQYSDGRSASCADVEHAFARDPLIAELLEQSLVALDQVPEMIEFRFSGSAAAPRVDIDEQASRWLADELTRLASERVAKSFDTASDRLDAQIRSELEALNRSVAAGRNEALLHINQQLDELRSVEASVLNNLQQRAGAHFARRPNDGLVQ